MTSAFAMLAVAGVLAAGSSSANAADLGGDCCADLEERIAELEATTARKGNRKVSLEVSGQVNEAVMFWDDGDESQVYVLGNDTARSRFRAKGKAKITSDWEAGYLLEIGVRTSRSDRVDQGGTPNSDTTLVNAAGALTNAPTVFGDDGTDNGLDIRHSAWYLKSKTYGSVWVGQSETATESITEINTANTGNAAKIGDIEDYFAGFQLRRAGVVGNSLSNVEWRRLMKDDAQQPGESNRRTVVRYVSPEFAGFTVSSSWGEDDIWDAAIRYKGEFNGIKIAGGFGYGENTERDVGEDPQPLCIVNSTTLPQDAKCRQWGGSISALHEPSGLFVSFAGGWFQDELINVVGGFAGATPDDESTYYTIQAGIEKKWTPLGKTTLYGEYFDFDGGSNDANITNTDIISPFFGTGGNSRILNSEIEVIGGGIVQSIDSAAMDVYITYRHFEADATFRATGGAAVGTNAAMNAEDLDVVMSGAMIKF